MNSACSIMNEWNDHWQGLIDTVKLYKTYRSSGEESLSDIFKTVIEKVKAFFKWLWEKIKSFFKWLWDKIKSIYRAFCKLIYGDSKNKDFNVVIMRSGLSVAPNKSNVKCYYKLDNIAQASQSLTEQFTRYKSYSSNEALEKDIDNIDSEIQDLKSSMKRSKAVTSSANIIVNRLTAIQAYSEQMERYLITVEDFETKMQKAIEHAWSYAYTPDNVLEKLNENLKTLIDNCNVLETQHQLNQIESETRVFTLQKYQSKYENDSRFSDDYNAAMKDMHDDENNRNLRTELKTLMTDPIVLCKQTIVLTLRRHNLGSVLYYDLLNFLGRICQDYNAGVNTTHISEDIPDFFANHLRSHLHDTNLKIKHVVLTTLIPSSWKLLLGGNEVAEYGHTITMAQTCYVNLNMLANLKHKGIDIENIPKEFIPKIADRLIRIIVHEFKHNSDSQSGKMTDNAYELAEIDAKGYTNNEFEVAARESASSFTPTAREMEWASRLVTEAIDDYCGKY